MNNLAIRVQQQLQQTVQRHQAEYKQHQQAVQGFQPVTPNILPNRNATFADGFGNGRAIRALNTKPRTTNTGVRPSRFAALSDALGRFADAAQTGVDNQIATSNKNAVDSAARINTNQVNRVNVTKPITSMNTVFSGYGALAKALSNTGGVGGQKAINMGLKVRSYINDLRANVAKMPEGQEKTLATTQVNREEAILAQQVRQAGGTYTAPASFGHETPVTGLFTTGTQHTIDPLTLNPQEQTIWDSIISQTGTGDLTALGKLPVNALTQEQINLIHMLQVRDVQKQQVGLGGNNITPEVPTIHGGGGGQFGNAFRNFVQPHQVNGGQ